MDNFEWMLEILNRAVLDWRLLIRAKAWKIAYLIPMQGGYEKIPNARCNFMELRQFFKSDWCAACLQLNNSSASAPIILEKMEAELAEAIEQDKKREARKRGQRTM